MNDHLDFMPEDARAVGTSDGSVGELFRFELVPEEALYDEAGCNGSNE